VPGFGASRRRLIAQKGRPMQLLRPADDSPPTPITVLGYTHFYRPEDTNLRVRAVAEAEQADTLVEILNDEIAAASFPPPDQDAQIVIDGQYWQLLAANPLYDASELIGWTLYLRGGRG